MEIKNVTLFLIGIAVLVLGSFIIIFDYPQIQLFENMSIESHYLLDEDEKAMHQKLIIEFSIGILILGVGILLSVSSFLKRFENGLR